jgi:DNA-binding transcriptional MerR regulator
LNLSIGELARATGVKPTTIRWYEAEGLLPPPGRTGGGHRVYGAAHRDRLGFIRHARELGFPMAAIRDLLDLAEHPDRDCNMAHAVATAQVAAIDAKLRQLTALRAELARMAEACSGGAAGSCRILEALADHAHGHCADPSHGDAVRAPGIVMQPAMR